MSNHANLLPYTDRRHLLVRKRLHQWLPVWLVVFLMGTIICGRQYFALAEQQRKLADLQAQELPLRQRMESVSRIRQRLGELQQRESLLMTHNSSGHPLQLMGMISQGAALVDGGLVITRRS